MIKNWTLLACFALILSACGSIFSSKPMGTLSEKEMVDMLVDINLTEASLKIGSDTTGRGITDTTNMRIRFAEVFRKHDVDPDDFNTSLIYYLEHIDDLDKIYAEVITRLTTLEATLREEPGHGNGPVNASGGPMGNPYNNPWFKTLMKNPQPGEIQYFSPAIYPYTHQKDMQPSPLLKKLL